MDAVRARASLGRICSFLACILVVCHCATGKFSTDTSLKGNPGSSAANTNKHGVSSADATGVLSTESEKCSALSSHGLNRPLMILSTVDGKVLALDILNAGQQQWSMDAGVGPLLSSSISQFEITGPEGTFKVIPSLDGGLFKWDGENIEAVPFTAETLLSASFKLSDDTMVVGGKEMKTFGINARTGELHYICGSSGCQMYGDEASDDQDIIIVQHTRHTVRAVDQRTGSEKWNFSVGQHDVSFLEGDLRPREDPFKSGEDQDEEDYVCMTEDEDVQDVGDYAPTVKVDMAAKTVFAVGGSDGTQLLWSHELDSCISNAWTIENGVVSPVDLFQPVTIGLTSDAEPRMTPFFSEFTQPLLYIGTHEKQLYVQPSPGTQAEVAQAAWAASRGQANPGDGSLMAPRVRWRPYSYTSASRTPSLVTSVDREHSGATKQDGKDRGQVTVWNQYPFDDGYYFLHQQSPLHLPPHRREVTESNDSDDGGLEILLSVSVWTWWREILTTSVVLAICMQVFFYHILKPRRRRRIAKEEKERNKDEEESSQTSSSNTDTKNASDGTSQEYKSRYLSDFEHQECLGKGGFGIVFQAKNMVDQNSYAIKRITLPNREEARAKVLREARTLARLDHSGIVRYFNSWLEEPPLGWQEVQDKEFVGDMFVTNDVLSTLNTSAFFNKNSELIRNREQLLQQTGVKSRRKPPLSPCEDQETPHLRRLREEDSNGSRVRREDTTEEEIPSSVESDILFPPSMDFSEGFSVGNDLEESGSFSIVFQGVEEDDDRDSEDKGRHVSAENENTPVDMADLQDPNNFNESWDNSTSEITDIPFKHYEDDDPKPKDYDRSESFHIIFEDSGCSDHLVESLSASQHSETVTSESSRSSITADSSGHDQTGEGGNKDSNLLNQTPTAAGDPSSLVSSSRTPVVKVPKIYLYIQMQLCRKETLKDWLNTCTLSRDRNKVLHIFHQILEAVSYIHGCGMIHRDLKPSNIFFSSDGKVKVGDFGLVTAIDAGHLPETEDEASVGTGHHLHTGRVGTQLYMSPEQVTGHNYDHKVDIFSLGLIFFELFHPFSTEMERIKVMCQAKRQCFPTRFTKELPLEAKFAKWLLSHNPEMRPDSEEVSNADLFTELYEDFVPPSTCYNRHRYTSTSSR